MPIYEKPVRFLMHDMVSELGIQKGQILTRSSIVAWFVQHYPKVKQATITAHLARMSTNAAGRVHHNVKPGEDDLFFQVDAKHYRLYETTTDPSPIYKDNDVTVTEDSDESDDDPKEFAYEADLQRFLAKNLSIIEPGLTLFEDDGITGIEFPVGGRFIDLLARDAMGNYVVVELKVSKGYDRVVGQLLRYMAWIADNLVEENEKVRGMIIARKISDDLILACSRQSDVDLFEYDLSVSLRRVDRR